ncbi:putative zinc finger protein CONSTANS-LIKE 11 [Impatiens glandulifera]|uniref:putative zinc finger protein CONSTANS-LIKE 11 n=1 Tax=Impatiens glandulifera TaxID=253017 RepID=UPI001FB19CE4|nr:putative zinc finger protein CONSTANS-LIKE 11 [Impatiens glandulifera]
MSSDDLFLSSFFPDPFDCILDLDILQEIKDTHYTFQQESPNPLDQSASIDQIIHPLPPPSSSSSSSPPNPIGHDQCFMQRSISLDERPANLNGVMESLNLNHVKPPTLNSPEMNPTLSFTQFQMRRVCSTGDLVEETRFRIGPGRYTPEEKKERIHKYREKRNQRNFSKKIKYACRKTLADSRPRVRGRFARNDEPSDHMIPKTATFNRYDEQDNLWINNNLNGNEGTVRGGNVFGLWNSTGGQLQD